MALQSIYDIAKPIVLLLNKSAQNATVTNYLPLQSPTCFFLCFDFVLTLIGAPKTGAPNPPKKGAERFRNKQHESLLFMTKNTTQLTHSLLLTIRNQNQSGGRVLTIGLIAAIEATSLELDDLVLLQVLAGIIYDNGVLHNHPISKPLLPS